MEYKKIENEIDNLLHNGGLNPYERKLLRKIKRKFCVDQEKVTELLKEYAHKCIEVWMLKKKRGTKSKTWFESLRPYQTKGKEDEDYNNIRQ